MLPAKQPGINSLQINMVGVIYPAGLVCTQNRGRLYNLQVNNFCYI